MTPINNKTLFNTVLALTVLAFLTACSSGGNNNNNKEKTVKTESLTITSYNLGLALNFVPYTEERLAANEELLADSDSDVMCLQEVWGDENIKAIEQSLKDSYPYIYTAPPEQVFSGTPPCTNEEIADMASCLSTQCGGLSDSAFVSCGIAQCSTPLGNLPPACFDGVAAAIGIPGIDFEKAIEAVTQPIGLFLFDGSLGLMLASKYELENRQFQDFIDDSSINHRGALYAEIEVNEQSHVIGCTHPTANLEASSPYPASGKHASWEGENRWMQEQMIVFANNKAGDNPILFGGDFNCGIANASNGVDADFAENCQLWLDDGFADPAADQLPCTYCEGENLILQEDPGSVVENLFLDHIFVKNLVTTSPIVADRVFDDPVSIEATTPPSELQPADSPMMTHPSDHFGVELELPLR